MPNLTLNRTEMGQVVPDGAVLTCYLLLFYINNLHRELFCSLMPRRLCGVKLFYFNAMVFVLVSAAIEKIKELGFIFNIFCSSQGRDI